MSRKAEHHLAICGATDVGAARPTNQDSFVIADLATGDLSNPCSRADVPLSWQGILLLVCDGMGARRREIWRRGSRRRRSSTGWSAPVPRPSTIQTSR